MAAPYWALQICAKHFEKYRKFENTQGKLGEMSFLPICYNITTSWLNPLNSSQFTFSLRDSENHSHANLWRRLRETWWKSGRNNPSRLEFETVTLWVGLRFGLRVEDRVILQLEINLTRDKGEERQKPNKSNETNQISFAGFVAVNFVFQFKKVKKKCCKKYIGKLYLFFFIYHKIVRHS